MDMERDIEQLVNQWQGRSWKDLSPRTRRLLQVGMAVQVSLFLIALVDLLRRPSTSVRGRKALWFPVLFANFVGPVSYLIFGRRGASATDGPEHLFEAVASKVERAG